MRALLTLTLLLCALTARAQGEINVLTDLNSPFPPGCIALSLPDGPASGDNELWDEEVLAPSVGATSLDSLVRVQIWRVGCHDPGYSIVMVRLQALSFPTTSFVEVPRVYANAGIVDRANHFGQLIPQPAIGIAGASSEVITTEGTTYMLAVEPTSPLEPDSAFLPEDYNGEFTFELVWEPLLIGELFPIAAYDPAFDPTQFPTQILHGRMSGQYTFDGIPFTGLQLLVGEQTDDTNFIFAIFFTYLNGEPYWVVGNTGGEAPGFPQVELEMLELVGGSFVGLGSFDAGDVAINTVGSLFIDPVDCDNIILGYDFSPIGGGAGVLDGRRFIDVAGYNCNPWQ
ncbi:MAG: hypothetical protein AAGJ52_13780 [Pseudomonadota bacterium]